MKKPNTSSTPPAARFANVPIDLIDVPADRQRDFQPAVAEAIAGTLPTLGLKQPIEVAPMGERFRLIAGLHRLEAAKQAGWETISARLVALDGPDIEASADLHEAVENLLRADLTKLDRMAHLAAMKAAHDKLYPDASRGGPRFTRADRANLRNFPKFAFSKEVAEHTGLDRGLVNKLLAAWEAFSPRTRSRLRGSWLADKQAELLALGAEQELAQHLILDRMLASPPEATTVKEALGLVVNKPLPTADARRVTRYQNTLRVLPQDQRDAILEGIEEQLQDFARRRGWLS